MDQNILAERNNMKNGMLSGNIRFLSKIDEMEKVKSI